MPEQETFIGIDECGIGTLAGPMCVSGVYLGGYVNPKIKDSKKITSINTLYSVGCEIESATENITLFASVATIDRHGTWRTWEMLVNEVIFRMRTKVGFDKEVLLDGSRRPPGQYALRTEVKADAKYRSVGAASIIAKMRRHQYCLILDKRYPKYGFARNDGYGTPEHIAAIVAHGKTKDHRKEATQTALRNHLAKLRRS